MTFYDSLLVSLEKIADVIGYDIDTDTGYLDACERLSDYESVADIPAAFTAAIEMEIAAVTKRIAGHATENIYLM